MAKPKVTMERRPEMVNLALTAEMVDQFDEITVAALLTAGARFSRRLYVYETHAGRVTPRQRRRAKHKLLRDDRRACGRKF